MGFIASAYVDVCTRACLRTAFPSLRNSKSCISLTSEAARCLRNSILRLFGITMLPAFRSPSAPQPSTGFATRRFNEHPLTSASTTHTSVCRVSFRTCPLDKMCTPRAVVTVDNWASDLKPWIDPAARPDSDVCDVELCEPLQVTVSDSMISYLQTSHAPDASQNSDSRTTTAEMQVSDTDISVDSKALLRSEPRRATHRRQPQPTTLSCISAHLSTEASSPSSRNITGFVNANACALTSCRPLAIALGAKRHQLELRVHRSMREKASNFGGELTIDVFLFVVVQCGPKTQKGTPEKNPLFPRAAGRRPTGAIANGHRTVGAILRAEAWGS